MPQAPLRTRQPKNKPKNVLDLCKTSFLRFMVAMDPTFKVSDFSFEVAQELQSFYKEAQGGKKPHVLLEAPPQHGKSTQVAQLFPAWLLGINPNLRIVIATYAFSLALKRNLAIQKIIESPPYQKVFPQVKLRTTRSILDGERDAEGFTIIGASGGIRFVGMGTGLTGHSMDIGIIDDPYKDMASARSPVINAKTIEWYHSVFETRGSKVAGIVMMLTRWTVNDLAGHLVATGQWKQLKYKAINPYGKALVPHLHSRIQLLQLKKVFPEALWEAMYQQNPIIQGGNIIKESWLLYYSALPSKFEKIFITGDTAFTTAEASDYSVFTVWGKSENNLYMLDMWRDKVISPDLKEATLKLWDKWASGLSNTPCSTFYIENKASGIGLIQELRRDYQVPIKAVERQKDKYTRLTEVLTYIEAGRLHLPLNAPWIKEVVGEMISFSDDNSHEHDDIVDTILDALNVAYVKKRVTSFDVL